MPTKPSVYVETTVVSYIAARTSSNAVLNTHQDITRHWRGLREQYSLYASNLVRDEATAGNASASAKRIALLNECQFLTIAQDDLNIAQQLLAAAALPAKAGADALHIAIAARNNMDYLLTWNCKHIANPVTQRLMQTVIERLGLKHPFLITPEQLLEIAP